MSQPATRCPACGALDPLFSAKRQVFVCEDCGHRWPVAGSGPALDWPADLAPDGLPTYLAAPLAALLAEPHPRLRLHGLVDCAEIALRWSVAVALAQVVQANAAALPEPVAARLHEHIERPTLGRWLGILETLSAARPAADLPAPGFFDLYAQAFAPRFRGERQGGTLDDSLLVLRNHLAHGAGLRTEAARALLQTHQPGVFDLLGAVARAGHGTQVIALTGDRAELLVGTCPSLIPRPADLRDCADGPWLLAGAAPLVLLPLADFGPVRLLDSAGRLEERPGAPAPQLYQRADRECLAYVPLGRDEAVSLSFDLDAFRALFRLDSEPASRRPTGEGLRWDDFLREARVLAEDLVGRAAELATLKTWLKGRDTRQEGVAGLGLVTGGPGVGKSLLMARLAADLGNAKPGQQGLYYHRFRAGDARNSTRAFLQGLLAALADWPALPPPAPADDAARDTDQALLDSARARLAAVVELAPPHPQAPPPRFLVLADGLDEVLPQDPLLPQRLCGLALPGTLWLLASRPEAVLGPAFGNPGCASLFPDGLPPMSANDIRAMLLEGLASAGKALIARDEDVPEGVRNPFIERVVACAGGLPLYVRLLLEDLRAGQLSVRDEAHLPRGLVAYYDALMDRIGLSDLKRDLPLLVACLARAEEPLDTDALALLLADVPAEAPRYRERVRQAARAGQALLRPAPTADGGLGLTLYHQSFRDYVGGRPAAGAQPAVPPAPALAGTVRDAESKLCRLADGWADLPPGGLRNHLFRWGARYAQRWQGEAGVESARRRLTGFDFLQACTAALPSSAIRGLVADYETLLTRLPDGAERQQFRLWEAFFREREHILRRGDERWSAHKTLLQLAVEHADDSPVTAAAEAWLEAGKCDWVWLRNPRRVGRAVPDPCLRVLEGHTGGIIGALPLADGRILSWSQDDTLRLWDGHSGAPLATLDGHTKGVTGALPLPDERILSWSWDGTLRLWESRSGAPLATLAGHTGAVNGALLRPDGGILSWSEDRTLRLRDSHSGAPLATLEGHTGAVNGALPLPDGRILSWSEDRTLRLWDGHSGAPLATLTGHTGEISGALPLPDGRILSWSNRRTLGLLDGALQWHRVAGARPLTYGGLHAASSRDVMLLLWDGHSGAPLVTLAGHFDRVWGALPLPDGRILSWSWDGTLRLWDGHSGAPLATLAGHTGAVDGALLRPDGRILSWSRDHTLRLWDGHTGTPLTTLDGHTNGVSGALPLPDGRILSWSRDHTLRLWDGHSGAPLATLAGHTGAVDGALLRPDGRILSWSEDRTLRLWDGHKGALIGTLDGHTDEVRGALALPYGCILSWSADGALRLWDGHSGAPLANLAGHIDVHFGALPLPDGRILSSFRDGTLRLWDGRSGAALATLFGHTDRISCALPLPDGRILSWCTESLPRFWSQPPPDRTLRLWDGHSGAPLATFAGHTDAVQGALPLPDGRILSWSDDGTLRLWDGHRGAPLATLAGRILSWCRDLILRLWDGDSETPLATLAGHTGAVLAALPLPDGRILSWSDDGTLRLWDGHKGAIIGTLDGHTDWVESALPLPDGRILSWSRDGVLRLWDGQDGQPIGEPIAVIELPWEHPALLFSRRQAEPPAAVSNQTAGWSHGNSAGVATSAIPTDPICWQGHAHVETRALLPEGILVVTLHSGHVFCLQLYRGAARIGIADYEHPGECHPNCRFEP